MKYLTKEWYELSQQTWLHYGKIVHERTSVYDDALYLRLYKRKENEYIKMQREVYEVDPRFMLELDECTLVRADKFARGEDINEEDTIVYRIPAEDRVRFQEMIDAYDTRPPFNEKKCREEFRVEQDMAIRMTAERLPDGLAGQIADMRVFALGYCTKNMLVQLKRLSKENKMKADRVCCEYLKAQQSEKIPENIRKKFCFHDREITELTINKNTVMRFDARDEFYPNKVTFVTSEVIKQEEHIVGSHWIYNELYRTEKGYEAHMLFQSAGMHELIICCKDIVIDRE